MSLDLVAARTGVAPAVVNGILKAAIDVGATVSPVDLLPGGEACMPLWIELCERLVPRGWHAEVVWDESTPRLVVLPQGATSYDYDACKCWWLTVEAYGDGTVNIHGAKPLVDEEDDLGLVDYRTVAEAIAAIGGVA